MDQLRDVPTPVEVHAVSVHGKERTVRMTAIVSVAPAAILVGVSALVADTVQMIPTKDATLYELFAGQAANGSGPHLFAGRTASGLIRRALVRFDVAANIPSGSKINSAALRMFMNRTESGPAAVSLHRVTADWGESTSNAGDSDDGGGANPAPGDATWIHTFFNSQFWSVAGGEFVPGISATQVISSEGSVEWPLTTGAVADVQDWLDAPSENYGWLLRGNEVADQTAMRFASREHSAPSIRPTLTVDFTPPPISGDTDGDGDVDLTDFAAYLDCVTGPGGGVSTGCTPVDFDADNDVDFADLGSFLRAFTLQ